MREELAKNPSGFDLEVFSDFFTKRLFSHSKRFKSYFPETFKAYAKALRERGPLSFDLAREITSKAYFTQIPIDLNSILIESLTSHFEEMY